ncbi:MAG: hypothetical protein M3Y26_01350 [Actinomycetota bacterium]|nr:hypothetical protein [Actinomycetota bacterium]
MFSLGWSGGDVASMIHQVTVRMGPAMAGGTDDAAARLVEVVVAHASGRPGPEVRTGNLVGSIRANPSGAGGGSTFSATVVVGASYGAFLERGTSKMPPYPFLGPAVADFRSEYRQIMADAVAKGLKP